MMRYLLPISCLAAALTVPALAQPAATPNSRAGINLSGVVDWSTELPFVDLFRSARAWASPQGEPELSPEGDPLLKPGQEAWTLLAREIRGHYPGGVYTLEHDGVGEIKLSYDAKEIVEERPGLKRFRVEPGDGGIEVRILRSDPADPIRNIRVWMPGFGPGEPGAGTTFNPAFLETIEPFGVLRFMDWGRTNDSPLVSWEERPEVADATWSIVGVPVEVMVDLANYTDKDPWLCVPHLANDEYVRQMARLVKERLEPERTAYIELSNEVWNWQFKQAQHAKAEAERLGLGEPGWLRAYAVRASEVLRIWSEELGDRNTVRVLASQAGWPWTAEQVLGFREAAKHADALAIAPYFHVELGPDEKGVANVAQLTAPVVAEFLASSGVAWTPESRALVAEGKVREALKLHGLEWEATDPHYQTLHEVARRHATPVMQQARATIAGDVTAWVRENKVTAEKYGLDLVAYEGGQHLVGVHPHTANEVLTALLIEANRDPRMYELYRDYLRVWDEEGQGLFCAFSSVGRSSKWGSWGALEWQGQPLEDAPKYRALVEWARGSGSAAAP